MTTKSKIKYGPLRATWEIWVNDGKTPKRCLVLCSKLSTAESDASYYVNELGYKIEIKRVEMCDCLGLGYVNKETRRRGIYRNVTCVGCRGAHTVNDAEEMQAA